VFLAGEGDFMKTLTVYVTEDGRRFDDPNRAEKYEALFSKVNGEIRTILPEKYDTTKFANGYGYIQLSARAYDDFLAVYLDLVKELFPNDFVTHKVREYHTGFIGRILSDCSSNPFSNLAYSMYQTLICCDTKTLRLYGQPYFAQNPENLEGRSCLYTVK
jgi:hypothetical protein